MLLSFYACVNLVMVLSLSVGYQYVVFFFSDDVLFVELSLLVCTFSIAASPRDNVACLIILFNLVRCLLSCLQSLLCPLENDSDMLV